MRRLTAIAVSLVLAGALAGCGDPIKGYCSALTKDQPQIADMISDTSSDALVTHLPLLKSLGAKAPDDLSDEWQTFLGAVEGLSDALKSAGIKPSAFANGDKPTGLSAAKLKAIIGAADQLSSDDVVNAANGIDQEAKDVCQIDLGV